MNDFRESWLKPIFREHPALIVSAFYVAASTIGMFYSWAYLRQFGINVFNYAQLSDFLLASLKEPFTWAMVFVAAALVWADNACSRRVGARNPGKWIGWYGSPKYRMLNNFVAIIVILILIFFYADVRSRSTMAGDAKQVEVRLADSNKVQSTVLLGTTGQFVFLFDTESERVDIHPIESIYSISFQTD